MVTDEELARWRLRSQHLVEPYAGTAADVVTSLLAVQAENPAQSAWAVACRTAEPAEADLAVLLDEGRVLRTHVLRPTWHYVHADDLGWLVELTAPRVLRSIDPQLSSEGHDAGAVERLTSDTLDALTAGPLTRPQVAESLEARGHLLSGHALMILLAHLELHLLVCSGPPADGVHTYARVADRVPALRRLAREEALGELAVRYFSGHGPATERDLAYWATLTLTDVRAGLALVRDRLESFEQDGRVFWHAPGESPPAAPVAGQQPRGHLLQILDELYRGYQDSRWVLDARGDVPRVRESAIGMGLVDAQLVAAMKRTVTDTTVRFDLRPYRATTPDEVGALEQAAARYGAFLRREPELSPGAEVTA